MKKCLQLAALVVVFVFALLSGTSRPAWAWSPCGTISGTTCSPNGSITYCDEGGGVITNCKCIWGYWRCYL
jgi:hypothetical protein